MTYRDQTTWNDNDRSPIRLSSQLRLFSMEKREITGGSSGSLLLERSKFRRTFAIRSSSFGNCTKKRCILKVMGNRESFYSSTLLAGPYRVTSFNNMFCKLHAPVLEAFSTWELKIASFLDLDTVFLLESLNTTWPESATVNSSFSSTSGFPVLAAPWPISLLQHEPITLAATTGEQRHGAK